jgi:hypothetical protein
MKTFASCDFDQAKCQRSLEENNRLRWGRPYMKRITLQQSRWPGYLLYSLHAGGICCTQALQSHLYFPLHCLISKNSGVDTSKRLPPRSEIDGPSSHSIHPPICTYVFYPSRLRNGLSAAVIYPKFPYAEQEFDGAKRCEDIVMLVLSTKQEGYILRGSG